MCHRPLEVAAGVLFAFDRLEESLEIAGSKAPGAVALEDLPDLLRLFLRRFNAKFRKQVQAEYDAQGGPMWRAAANEVVKARRFFTIEDDGAR